MKLRDLLERLMPCPRDAEIELAIDAALVDGRGAPDGSQRTFIPEVTTTPGRVTFSLRSSDVDRLFEEREDADAVDRALAPLAAAAAHGRVGLALSLRWETYTALEHLARATAPGLT